MSLAIPDPATVDLDRARDLAAAVVAWAEECDDLTALEDARAKVAAIETYLRRRGEAVAAEIAAADRRLEVRIGALLGPAPTPGRPSAGAETSAHGHLPRQRASEFRQMAEHQDVPAVADAIGNGASRREVLSRIRDHKQRQADDALADEIDGWADTLPEQTDPVGDRLRSDVWSALMGAADAARNLAKFAPEVVADAIGSHPFPHVAEQMTADLTEAVDTFAAYQEVVR